MAIPVETTAVAAGTERSAAPTTPLTAIRAGTRSWLSFEGRANRKEFWWFLLFVFVAGRIVDIAAALLFVSFVSDGMHVALAALLWTVVQLGSAGWFALALVSAGVRRAHDAGRSAWWLLVPIANLVVLASPTATATTD